MFIINLNDKCRVHSGLLSYRSIISVYTRFHNFNPSSRIQISTLAACILSWFIKALKSMNWNGFYLKFGIYDSL